jgi:HSP20 family molecular chaperone IbpA
VFGVVSFLVDVAAVITAAAGPSDDHREKRHMDSCDSEEPTACRPLVDVVEEEGELVILIEIPGFYSTEMTFRVQDDILILADDQDHEFHEILLPEGYNLDDRSCISFNNGVTTIKFPKVPVPCSRRKIA